MLHNNDANNFDPNDPQTQQVIERFAKRCCTADPQREAVIRDHIDKLITAWHQYQQIQEDEQRMLCYDSKKDDSKSCLLYSHGESRKGLWMTLQSMRNVENTGLVKIL